METITYEMVNERALETARDIMEQRPEGGCYDIIDEIVEAWDWNIYDYYVDQLFLLAIQRDDRFIKMIQANNDEYVEVVKALVASAYTCDLVYAALKRMGV